MSTYNMVKNKAINNKKTAYKNIPKTETKREVKNKFQITPISILNRNIIIAISIVVSFFFMQQEIIKLENDVHWGDEVLNMLTVKNIVKTGLPIYGTFAEAVSSPLNSNDALTVSYWEYTVELYLRTPVYLMSKVFDFHWEYYSSTIYLYMIFIFLLVFYLMNKNTDIEKKFPFMSIAFFMLIFCYSKYSTSQFHNLRSYSFTITALPLVHYITNNIFLHSKLNTFKKYLFILFLAFLPSVFHMANLIYFAFWLSFLIVYAIYNGVKNSKEKFNLVGFVTKNIKLVLFGVALTIVLGFLANFVLDFLKSRLFFSSENINVIPTFFSFYFSKDYIIYNLIFFALFVFTLFNIKKFSKIELNLFISSIGFILFALFGFSIIGGQSIIANPYAYMMFMLPIIFLITSLMLTLLFRVINNLIPAISFKEPVIFIVIASMFLFINSKKFDENEGRSDGDRKELEMLIDVSKKYKDLIFVCSKNAHYFYNYIPNNKAYLLRDYQPISETNVIKDDFYKSTTGWVKDIGGEIFVGKTESFCRMINENTNSLFYFHRVMPNYVSKDLMDKLNTIFIGNPMSGKYIKAMLCSVNDSEKTQNILEIINENGLMEGEYINMGAYLFNQNRFEDCITACNKGLTLNPNNTNAMINIGVSYIRLKKFEEAIKINEKVLSIDPKSEQAQQNIQYAKELSRTGRIK